MECKCNKCGIEVKGLEGLVCDKCNKPLIKGTVSKNGKQTFVAKCPGECGVIKTPTCCGQDMICT